ncbi:PmoA family protein [Microbacterium allomyrinae]|uniref:PmoA family protein n=1 Tax=Microbacterium allomyrinae TaxID=2830666 RepID=A0A9X1LTD8_9MICO|nr:PmoA family protein [Microbacterium allomyrinae]MCC2031614.1 PmoA family protein [Microbacterium allomyrinae]
MPDFTLRLDEDDATVTAAGIDIARYAFAPEGAASEGPKPYLHPLRALDGAPLTAFRPWDHRWHKGLQMTWTHVSGQNFWGGPTYRRDIGYTPLDNVGRMRHNRFTRVTEAGAEVSLIEDLTWITRAGDEWLAERRAHRFHSLDLVRGVWALDFSTTLRNTSDHDLELGSPTTQGRPNAGYTGFVIRMPRAWTGGRVQSATGHGVESLMGAESAWVAFSGEHDEFDGGGTVLVFAGTVRVSRGTATQDRPIKWFVRSEPFPILAPSPSFDEPIVLAPGDEVSLSHRHVFGDRIWSPDETRAIAADLAL